MLTGIISSLIASIVSGIAVWMYRSAQVGGIQKFLVFPPNGDQLATGFYAYFRRQIDLAKTEIIVTGEGFGYKGVEGPKQADAYHDSMRSALQRGVHVTRIQTARSHHPLQPPEPLHPRWAEKLKECVRDFPKLFHLYILDNEQFQEVLSVCVIDADTRKNVVELALSVEKDVEDTSARLASTGVFIHGQRELATAMKENLVAIKKLPSAKKCETEADIDRFLN